MTISFELPGEIEERIRNESIDVNDKAKEAFLVELYREQKITQHQLGQTLGLDDYETDGLLKRYGVGYDLSLDEFEEQRAYFVARYARGSQTPTTSGVVADFCEVGPAATERAS